MTTSEAIIIGALKALGHPVSGDVPAERPQRFVTVERTGGKQTPYVDHGTFAVQAWADTRAKAGELAQTVAANITMRLAKDNPNIAQASVESMYNFPDPDSATPRYQITMTAIIKLS